MILWAGEPASYGQYTSAGQLITVASQFTFKGFSSEVLEPGGSQVFPWFSHQQ